MLDKMFVRAQVEKDSFNDEEQSFVAFASRPVVDRENEIIAWNAWDTTNYDLNPVILWAHEYRAFPLGSSQWTKRTRQGLKFKPGFTKAYPDGSIVYLLYQDGSLKAFSVGFIPKEWIKNDDEDKGIWSLWKRVNDDESEQIGYYFDTSKGWTDKKSMEWNSEFKPVVLDIGETFDLKASEPKPDKIYTKAELLEISCVPVPSCPTALVEAYNGHRIKTKGLLDYVESTISEVQKDKNIQAVELLRAFDEGEEFNPMKPYPGEHACRINDPGKYDRLRRNNCKIKHDGKCIDVIFGVKDGKSEIQALRYKKDVWTAAAARSHCKEHEGSFEAASSESSIDDIDDDLNPQAIAGLVTEAIKEIFKPPSGDDKNKDREKTLDDFDLDELPTPEELRLLKEGKVF